MLIAYDTPLRRLLPCIRHDDAAIIVALIDYAMMLPMLYVADYFASCRRRHNFAYAFADAFAMLYAAAIRQRRRCVTASGVCFIDDVLLPLLLMPFARYASCY